MTVIKPITPAAAKETYEAGKDTPEFVIEIVNALIAEHYEPNGFIIKQDDVVAALMLKDNEASRQDVFDRKWLNFERVFRAVGWHVDYWKPGIGDIGSAYFKFND